VSKFGEVQVCFLCFLYSSLVKLDLLFLWTVSKSARRKMWVELICGLILFRLLKRYFYDYDDADHLDVDSSSPSSDASVLFTVGDRLQNLYGGKCHVDLNIHDANSASRRNIDIVLITDR
jgi:hypothetical protein